MRFLPLVLAFALIAAVATAANAQMSDNFETDGLDQIGINNAYGNFANVNTLGYGGSSFASINPQMLSGVPSFNNVGLNNNMYGGAGLGVDQFTLGNTGSQFNLGNSAPQFQEAIQAPAFGSSKQAPIVQAPVVTSSKAPTQLPLLQNQQTSVNQPIVAQPITKYRVIQQPIVRPRIVEQPILQTRILEQPILTVRNVIQPVIRPVITQPIIQPLVTETTTIQPRLMQQTVVKPKLMEQTVIQQQEVYQQQEAQPITSKPAVTQQTITAPMQQATISNTKKGQSSLGLF